MQMTGKTGRFVKSHLMLQALTRPAASGLSFIEGGIGRRAGRRWDNWYDAQLTTRGGEKILSDLDDWAIEQLGKHRLIWSGWKNSRSPVEQSDMLPLERVGHDHPRERLQALQQLAKEALGGFGIAPVLHQVVEHMAVLVDGNARGSIAGSVRARASTYSWRDEG